MSFLNPKQLGIWGESTAESYLIGKGIEIIERNFRTRFGEIDIIGKDNDTYLFFEVKTRQSERFGYPEEAVTESKLERMETVIFEFFEKFEIFDVDWRIDIISIIRNPKTEQYEITWINNVVA